MTNTILMSLVLLIVESRAIACTKDEYTQLEQWRMAKAKSSIYSSNMG